MKTNVKIKLLLTVKTEIKTISIFLCANWMEREPMILRSRLYRTPSLKRILNMDEMISSYAKEFPLEDGGRTDKDDRFFGRTIDNC
jgi:NADH-quinone oxidoreductase subunit C